MLITPWIPRPFSMFENSTVRSPVSANGLMDYVPLIPVAASALYGIWRWRQHRPAAGNENLRTGEQSPYRSLPENHRPRRDHEAVDPPYALEVPKRFRRMSYGPLTIGDFRIDTQLDFERNESGWQVTRRGFGRLPVRLEHETDPLTPGQPRPLRDGDRIRIGEKLWIFRLTDD